MSKEIRKIIEEVHQDLHALTGRVASKRKKTGEEGFLSGRAEEDSRSSGFTMGS